MTYISLVTLAGMYKSLAESREWSKETCTRWNSKTARRYKNNKKLVFFCKHFIGCFRNSPLRIEYNDLHYQEDY